jgi:hypothetical protein
MLRLHKAISLFFVPQMTKVSQTQADTVVNILGIGVQAVDVDDRGISCRVDLQ